MAAHTISYQVQPDSALTRTASLETFRLAVLGCRRPFWAERATTGSAAAKFAVAGGLYRFLRLLTFKSCAGINTQSESMRILVTGAAGFIGYHTARALLARGEAVAGLDNLNPYYDVTLKQARLAMLESEPA